MEKMAKLREEIAVQKAKETELNKTIHITGLSFFVSKLICIKICQETTILVLQNVNIFMYL